MKRTILSVVAAAVLALAGPVAAAGLSKADRALIEGRGIVLYPGAVFYGSGKSAALAGFNFMTADSIDEVRKWYAERLAGWSHTEFMGIHYFYEGRPGLKWSDLMGKTNIEISRDENAHKWHDELKPGMTTKIHVTVVPGR